MTGITLRLADIGQGLHDKLANAGLIEGRESSSLGMFLKAYLQRRAEAKPATVRKWQSAVNLTKTRFLIRLQW